MLKNFAFFSILTITIVDPCQSTMKFLCMVTPWQAHRLLDDLSDEEELLLLYLSVDEETEEE